MLTGPKSQSLAFLDTWGWCGRISKPNLNNNFREENILGIRFYHFGSWFIWLQIQVLHSPGPEQRGKMQRGFGEADRHQPKLNQSGKGKWNKHSGFHFRCLATFPVQFLNTWPPLAETLLFLCSLSPVRMCLVTCLKHCEFQSYFGITLASMSNELSHDLEKSCASKTRPFLVLDVLFSRALRLSVWNVKPGKKRVIWGTGFSAPTVSSARSLLSICLFKNVLFWDSGKYI